MTSILGSQRGPVGTPDEALVKGFCEGKLPSTEFNR
jgi:hypothetical protein